MQKQLTVFIGRLSPFHLGHEEVLLRALKSSEVVLLLLGSCYRARDTKNPFTGDEREGIVLEWYNHALRTVAGLGKLRIVQLKDYMYNDSKWIAQVQEVTTNTQHTYGIKDKPFLTGANRDASSWYLKAFGDFFQLDLVSETNIGFDLTATSIREDFLRGGNLWEYKLPPETIYFLDKFKAKSAYADLRAELEFIDKYKASWKAAPYPPIFTTVDAVVIQSGHVLAVRRGAHPGKGQLALPGGFVEQGERLEDAAIRELVEETRIEVAPAQLRGSISTREVFDHPGRSTRGRTITHAFGVRLKDTLALPRVRPRKGEIKATGWIPLSKALNSTEWYEDHKDILETLVARMS